MKKIVTKEIKEEEISDIESVAKSIIDAKWFDYDTSVDDIDIDELAKEFGIIFEDESEKEELYNYLSDYIDDKWEEHLEEIEDEYFSNRKTIIDTLSGLSEQYDVPADDIIDMIIRNGNIRW